MSFQVIDPSTGRLVRTVDETPRAEVERILAAAARGFGIWRRVPIEERAVVLRKVAASLRSGATEWAELIATEMGKPIQQGRTEVEKCAAGCEYYADHAADLLAPEPAKTEARRSYVSFEPLGVVLAIMPWNFPFWQVVRFGAPALMAGNAVLLKHAPNVPGCAEAMEGMFRDAGVPEGVFQAVYLQNEGTGNLVDRREISAVTLTGSTRAGREVASRAGRALKKTVLELGGSDPYLILPGADMARAVEACVRSRLQNGGQSCVAAKRLVVVKELEDEFVERLVARMKAAKVGNPKDESTEVGPLARRDLRDALHHQVRASVEAGAELLLGGVVPDGDGWFYPPTVLRNVGPGMPAYDEELFGPVAVVIAVENEDEAVRVANDSVYGLGGAVFTQDLARGEEIARERLDVGCAFVNDFVRSDPSLPFGGVRDSGYGRELGSFGIREFVNVKLVWVA
jgi:succinate-semialdehyde dehydrogenase/glutarate-semialdehyde dehydrogenase